MAQAISLYPYKPANDRIYLFDLGVLLPNRELLVNVSVSIISLLVKQNEKPNSIIVQRVLTDTEMRVLLPLLASPSCCPQEVLQASYHCDYEILLQSVFSFDSKTVTQWNELVQEHRSRLSHADQRKSRRAEMKGVYNALYSLRQKLEQLGLTIRSRKDGYYFSLLENGYV